MLGLDFNGGFATYRYGARREVSLSRKGASRPIYEGEARYAMVDRVVAVLRNWRSSRFENEAATLYGIRSALVMCGHSWHQSDIEAKSIIRSAFCILGYQRPTWLEGQREHSIPAENCKRCGSEVPPELKRDRRINFCSDVCAKSHAVDRMIQTKNGGDEVYNAAMDTVRRSANPKRKCPQCGTKFRPAFATGVFCSDACSKAARRIRPDRDCKQCGKTFRPRKSTSRYCSPSCAHQAQIKPRVETVKTKPHYVLRCQCCGTGFVSSRPHALYCSDVCQKTASRISNPVYRPKRISPLITDCLIIQAGGTIRDTVPAHLAATPAALDAMFEQAGW